MSDNLSPLKAAIAANVEWCKLVWSHHGLSVHEEPGLVYCKGGAPTFFPDVITTSPEPEGLKRVLDALSSNQSNPMFIKDSFDCLNLDGNDYTKLFSSYWIYRQADEKGKDVPDNWEAAHTATDLSKWEKGLLGDLKLERPIYPASLCDDTSTAFHSNVESGYSIWHHEDLAAVSNIHGDFREALQQSVSVYGEKRLTSYEAGDDLQIALSFGFKAVGQLSIWQENKKGG